jgi:hypothetical protein
MLQKERERQRQGVHDKLILDFCALTLETQVIIGVCGPRSGGPLDYPALKAIVPFMPIEIAVQISNTVYFDSQSNQEQKFAIL